VLHASLSEPLYIIGTARGEKGTAYYDKKGIFSTILLWRLVYWMLGSKAVEESSTGCSVSGSRKQSLDRIAMQHFNRYDKPAAPISR
jgi:hypothetical protein